MSQDRPSSPLERLVPAVAQYATNHFHLKEDLEHLHDVQRVGAPEAVILYCARILDALSAAALQAVLLPTSPNVFANLDTLQQYNLIPIATRYWAHALRRTGNLVRHIRRRVGPGDADLAVLFVERWLEWFFRGFRYGLRLPNLTSDGQPVELSVAAGLRVLLEALEDIDRNLEAVLRQVDPGSGGQLLRAPALPAVLAEMLLDRGKTDQALLILNAALKEFPDDLRLRQLQGLFWSRTGNLDEALQCLEPLYEQYMDDDETAGITAGVYKRLWLRDRNTSAWMVKSHRAYLQGWERSRKSNVYLGINAATTALWMGRAAESRPIAEEVRRLLRVRAGALARHESNPDLALNYWDRVTLAEAELLSGELAVARQLYQDTFARHAEQQRANIEVTRKQLDEILRMLGMSYDSAGFLGQSPGV